MHILQCTGASEADELYVMCKVLGTPTADSWPDGLRLAEAMRFRWVMRLGDALGLLICKVCCLPNSLFSALDLSREEV